MNVTLKNYSLIYTYGRNVMTATMHDVDGNLIASDMLANLLVMVKKEGHVITNAQEVLDEVVMKFGYGA